MESPANSLRVLMFPWLAHGHMYPYFELAKRLSRRGLKLYICSSPINLAPFRSQLPESSIQFVDLHLPSDDLSPELHSTKNLPAHLSSTLVELFQNSDSIFSPILAGIQPDLLIYDAFQPWAAKIASSKGIPTVHLSVIGAAPLSYLNHVMSGRNSEYPFSAIYFPDSGVKFEVPKIKGTEEGFYHLSTDIVLVSSCRELESKYLDYLSVQVEKKAVPTGPLISLNTEEDQSGITEWLNEKPQFSTLYVSFGSECFLSEEQIHELAQGLELSGANFILVMRFSSPEKKESSPEEVLPLGFLQRTDGRCRIVTGWAPQSRILAHPSVGAFVSHCGWNSVTESLYLGVPIVAMPAKFEQPLTAKMLAEAGVAVEVEREYGGIYRGKAIAKAVNDVLVEKKISRIRVQEMSRGIRDGEDGDVDAVADELLKICRNHKP